MTAYGEDMSSAPTVAPSTLNWTPATPTLSEAVAVKATLIPDTVSPESGAVRETVGGLVSTGSPPPWLWMYRTMPAGVEDASAGDEVASIGEVGDGC